MFRNVLLVKHVLAAPEGFGASLGCPQVWKAKPCLRTEREREMTWKVLGKKQLQPSLYNANIHTHMQKCSFPPAEIWHRQIKLVCPASASNKYAHMPRGVKREKWDFSCFHARLCTYTHAYELEDVKHTCVTTYMHIYTCERVSVCLSCQLQCPGHSHPSWVLAEQLAGGSSGREAAAVALHFPHSAFQHTWKCSLFWPRAGAGGHCFLVIVPLRGRKGQKREGASWNMRSSTVLKWEGNPKQGSSWGLMGLARCARKMILTRVVCMSQTRIIKILQWGKKMRPMHSWRWRLQLLTLLSSLMNLFLKGPSESCGQKWMIGKHCRFLSRAVMKQWLGWLWWRKKEKMHWETNVREWRRCEKSRGNVESQHKRERRTLTAVKSEISVAGEHNIYKQKDRSPKSWNRSGIEGC